MEVPVVEGNMNHPQAKTEEDVSKNISQCSKMKLLLKNITIEPIMICIVLPGLMSLITTQNLTLEKSCRVNLALDTEICDALSTRNYSYPDYKTHEATVQKLAANLTVWKSVIQSLLPPFLLLFLGTWSDRHQRRKPIVMSSLLGEICTCVSLLLCVFFFYKIPLEIVILAESVPTVFFGGFPGMFLGTFSYISSITTVEDRTARIGAIFSTYAVTSCIGTSLSGLIFQNLGFHGVYFLALFMNLSGFVYGFFFVKDVRDLQENQDGIIYEKKQNFVVDFFNFKQVGKTLKVVFKNDGHNRRKKMCWILILGMTIMGPVVGEMDIAYYYVRYKLGWSGMDFSIFSTVFFILRAIGTMLVLTFLVKLVTVDDSVLGMICGVSRICCALLYAFAPNTIIFYLGVVADMFSNIPSICMKSIATKTVSAEEMGALYAVMGFVDSLSPLIYGPLYSKTYAVTLDIFPGTCYLISAILTVPTICIFLWFYCQQKKLDCERQALKSQKEALMENYSKRNLENPDNLWKKNDV